MEPNINHNVHKCPARGSIMNHETDASSDPPAFHHFKYRINTIFIANLGLPDLSLFHIFKLKFYTLIYSSLRQSARHIPFISSSLNCIKSGPIKSGKES